MTGQEVTQSAPRALTPESGGRGERIAFLALARNCAVYLPRLFNLLDAASAQGFTVTCYIGENGSSDGSRALIRARSAADPRVTLVNTDAMSNVPERLARMASGRDIVREAWAAVGAHAGGYVCVLDVDDVLPADSARIDLAGAAAALRCDSALAGISASSQPFYYDLLALRAPGLFNYDIGPSLAFGARDPLFHYLVHAHMIYPTQRTVTARLPLSTKASFNGMALYRAEDYALACYSRTAVIDECEHVDFSRQLCSGGRHILAGVWFDLDMPAEHGPRSMFGFVRQRLSKAFGR